MEMCGRERLAWKLRGIYDSGGLAQLPFLSAADASPLAILADIRTPYMDPEAPLPPLGVCHRTATHRIRDRSFLALSPVHLLAQFGHAGQVSLAGS